MIEDAWRFLWSCLIVLGVAHGLFAAPGARPTEDFAVAGHRVVALVREHFYDLQLAEAWAAAHANYAANVENRDGFASVTKQVLAQLQTSHVHFYTPADSEYYSLLAIFRKPLRVPSVEYDSLGADFTPEHFVKVVFAGGPAAQAGLRRGDQVLQADGKDFDPVLSLRGRAGRPIALTVRRQADQPPLEVAVTPRTVDPQQEWLDAQQRGSRVIARRQKKIAYVPLFSCAGAEYEAALQAGLRTALQDADALVLDIRDGWGGCKPEFLQVLNPVVPVLTQIGRDGRARQRETAWRKPLYLLINRGTRSGKELIAFAVKKHRLGTLVGQRTAGAVMGGRCFLLPDNSLLYLAVADIRIDGERLESQGIWPDVEVPDTLAFANGADPQLDVALDLAAR